jgi:hypothetical protein
MEIRSTFCSMRASDYEITFEFKRSLRLVRVDDIGATGFGEWRARQSDYARGG